MTTTTSARCGRLAAAAAALLGVNASLLGLRYHGGGSGYARAGGGVEEEEEEEELRAYRSEVLRRFRDSRLTKPGTTPADLLLLPENQDEQGPRTSNNSNGNNGDGSPAAARARDPGYAVAESPGKGMGLFATRFIPARARILDEKPVLTLPANNNDKAGGSRMLGAADLRGFVAQVAGLAPALRGAVVSLQGERVALWRPQMEHYREILRREEFPPVVVQDQGAGGGQQEKVDSSGGGSSSGGGGGSGRLLSSEERSRMEHILRVFYTNAAALVGPLRPPPHSPTKDAAAARRGEIGHVGDGLFLTFSRINHSCEANAVWDTCRRPGVMSIRAARDIQPGEEITISYFWETAEAVEKRREKTKGWGFVCQCVKCGPVLAES